MTHIRTQIRDAVAARVTGLPTTGANVFKSRVYPIQPTELPGILVYSLSERSEAQTMGHPRLMFRFAEIAVEILASANDDLDDILDQATLEVEKALSTDTNLGGVCKRFQLTGSLITLKGEAESPIGSARLTYEGAYSVSENDPENLR